MIPRFVLASENEHKIREFGEILGSELPFDSLRDLHFETPLPEEALRSYEENAAVKAGFVGEKVNRWCLGDDSGVEVEALDWKPGLISARFLGVKDSALQRKEILKRLEKASSRVAKFVCVLALFDPNSKRSKIFRGEVKGQVALLEKGERGFGYDALFIPDGFQQTFAELESEQKNQISHRARAIRELKNFWRDYV